MTRTAGRMNTPPAKRSRRAATGRHQDEALSARGDAWMLTESESFSPVPGTEWDEEGWRGAWPRCPSVYLVMVRLDLYVSSCDWRPSSSVLAFHWLVC